MDSTAMTTFMTCPRKYFYRIVLGYTPKTTQPYFAFGSAYHKFRETLTLVMDSKLDGKSYTEEQALLLASAAAISYADKHLKTPIKGTSSFDFLTLDRLKLSLVTSFKHWKEERKRGQIKVLAPEQPFSIQLPDGTWIAGRYDEIVSWNGRLWVRDFKTSSKQGPWYERGLEPNDQFTRYAYAASQLSGKHIQGVVVEVLFNSKTQGPEIKTYTTGRTKSQIDNWLKEHLWWVKQIDSCRDVDMWPMNPKSCAMCEFHKVCKAPSESGQMSVLKTDFKHSPWDCSKVEQDG